MIKRTATCDAATDNYNFCSLAHRLDRTLSKTALFLAPNSSKPVPNCSVDKARESGDK
jgi:hypothetical protein